MLALTAELEEDFARGLIAKLPAFFRIGASDIRIVIVRGNLAHGQNMLGEFSTATQELRIKEDLPTRYQVVDTFLHEAMHGIYHDQGIEKEDDEERIVGHFGTGLTILIRDNPWLLDWLKEAKL